MCASVIAVRTSTSSPWLVAIACTNDLSIFNSSTGRCCRYVIDECPVPKSSIDRLIPPSCSARSTVSAFSGSAIATLSVISSFSREAGSPVR